jgi:replicative DNA helicase
MQLLLRFGINSRIYRARKAGYRDSWHLNIFGAENQRKFLQQIDVHGEKFFAAREVLANIKAVSPQASSDTVPKEVWNQVRAGLSDQGLSHRALAAAMGTKFCGSVLWKHSTSRKRLHQVAALLNDTELHDLAVGDAFWDKVVEITSIGDQDVYDGTVPGTNSFVAQGISVHNSLEQDADMVILLHRPDAFERDDPRGGEADLILGKHRNGPTKTITVAHQLHLSRFANMAK